MQGIFFAIAAWALFLLGTTLEHPQLHAPPARHSHALGCLNGFVEIAQVLNTCQNTTNAAYTYAGCPMFPGTIGGNSGGWFDTDVLSATPATSITYNGDGVTASSATIIANWASADSSGMSLNAQVAWKVGNTPNGVTLYPITGGCAGGAPVTCSLPGPASAWAGSPLPPALPNLYWTSSSASDPQFYTTDTSTCLLYVGEFVSFSGTSYTSFDAVGGLFDLTKPYPMKTPTRDAPTWAAGIGAAPAASAGGLVFAALSIKPAELQAAMTAGTFIHHALGFNLPGNETGSPDDVDYSGWIPPAITNGGHIGGTPTCATGACIPMGAHLRLKSTFSDGSWGIHTAGYVIAETLKHFGGYVTDTNCCFLVGYVQYDDSGIDPWTLITGTDGTNLGTVHAGDFDVIAPTDSNAAN